MRKTVIVALILTCLMTLTLVICVRPIKAQYEGSITINVDGGVTPSTAPIKQTGSIYTLTSNVDGIITVLKSNIVFNGNGQTITGKGVIGAGGLSIGYLPSAPTAGVFHTSNVTVVNFTITGGVFGISLLEASNVTVANNTITETGNGPLALDEPTAGISVQGGGSNVIAGNNLANNYDAMSFLETENNLIVGNNITDTSNPFVTVSAVMFWGASNNTIYHNNFINNTPPAGDAAFNSPFSINTWDDGYPMGGNYWSDYQTRYPNATEIDNSGIGDTPYVIDPQNKDQYPLMEPFTTTPPKISILSPLNQTYNETDIPLVFVVNKPVNWTGYSLDGKGDVTVTGNDTIANLTNGLHSITFYANDTFGNVGASETISFSVAAPTSFPTTLVITVVVAAAVVGAGLFVYFKKRKH